MPRQSSFTGFRQDTLVKAPPLPTDCIHPSALFFVSGVDHAGQLYCTDAEDSIHFIVYMRGGTSRTSRIIKFLEF